MEILTPLLYFAAVLTTCLCSAKSSSRGIGFGRVISRDNMATLSAWVENNKEKLKTIFPVLDESKRDSPAETSNYHRIHITNSFDYDLRGELDRLDVLAAQKPQEALAGFQALKNKYGNERSPRTEFGIAQCYSRLDTDASDNEDFTRKAADAFCTVLKMPDVPQFLLMQSGHECLRLQRVSLGRDPEESREALVSALAIMAKEFPAKADYAVELAWNNLLLGEFVSAIRALQQETCLKFKGNKLAHMILGLALKLLQSADASESHMHKKITNENALRLLASTAVASPEDEKVVAEAYCALGNYYRKTGRHNEAELVFEEAFAQGHLLSKWQRFSLLDDFYQPHIVSKPIWNVSESGYEEMFNRLTQNYSIFRQEAVTIFEDEKTCDISDVQKDASSSSCPSESPWKQVILFDGGLQTDSCSLAPNTCRIISELDLPTRGQVKFSALLPGGRVRPHVGPTNTRLRAHLGLSVTPAMSVGMRIADETATWVEGELLIIDDSFEHEVWHDGDEAAGARLVLLVDLWHPAVAAEARAAMRPLPRARAEQAGDSAVLDVTGEWVVRRTGRENAD